MTLGFLGTGTITAAMVTGLRSGAGGEAYDIRLSPRNALRAVELAARFPRVAMAASNQELVDSCETVVIAVRPQIVEEVVGELRFREGQKVISVVSGLYRWRLAELVAPVREISRAVPLPSAARRASPTGVCPRHAETIALFSLLGAAFAVDREEEFAAFCTATATMASFFAFVDGVAGWLERQGIGEQAARDYLARIYAGLCQTAVDLPELSFQTLAAEHATRGGTNEQVLRHLTEDGVFESLQKALDGILRRVTAGSRKE